MNCVVLVVEDNGPNRELMFDWLSGEGYEAFVVPDLASGFAALETMQPHAVLLDVQLGPEDGLALARWMRQHPRLQHVPVIAVTAHAMIAEQERILQSGCNACVSKPVDFDQLREQLRRWLRQPSCS